MLLPDYMLIGSPKRFRNGRGKYAKNYAQKFRLLRDPPRKIRSVSLKTPDRTVALRRVSAFVEKRIYELAMSSDPHFRTQHGSIHDALREYVDDQYAIGNTKKQTQLVKSRIQLVIDEAGFTEYAQIDAVRVTKSVDDLQHKGQFSTTATANKYLEALRAWTRWMLLNGRWDRDLLAVARKIKGDTSNSRPRTILSQEDFEKLLHVTKGQPDRRNLCGEQRYWLYRN